MSTFNVTIDSLRVVTTEVVNKTGNLPQQHSIYDYVTNICICATLSLIVLIICITYYIIRKMEHKRTVKRLVNEYLHENDRAHEELNKKIEEALRLINEQKNRNN